MTDKIGKHTLGKFEIHEASKKNTRLEQQDAELFGLGKEKSTQELQHAFNHTAQKIRDKFGHPMYKNAGTTGAVVSINSDGSINCINVGDSPIYLFVYNKETKQCKPHLLTKKFDRMPYFGNQITSSLNNHEMPANHTYQYHMKDFEITQECEVLVMAACDGLFETVDALSHAEKMKKFKDEKDTHKIIEGEYEPVAQRYAQRIEEHYKKGRKENLADVLTEDARERGSKDNLSALIAQVPNKIPKDQNLILGIFDGYRSSEISKFTAQELESEWGLRQSDEKTGIKNIKQNIWLNQILEPFTFLTKNQKHTWETQDDEQSIIVQKEGPYKRIEINPEYSKTIEDGFKAAGIHTLELTKGETIYRGIPHKNLNKLSEENVQEIQKYLAVYCIIEQMQKRYPMGEWRIAKETSFTDFPRPHPRAYVKNETEANAIAQHIADTYQIETGYGVDSEGNHIVVIATGDPKEKNMQDLMLPNITTIQGQAYNGR